MIHIEKITIDNARRFGQGVELVFGKGATILLAPNGTGKTTVFEAIELALTGRVERLEKFPDAIVRDGLSEMKVRLDFSEDRYCQVSYTKGMICIRQGDHEQLFGIENNLSLPYLFRLTHFLEQRGNEWFVEQNDNNAGKLLSQLPIGKNMQHIISKRTSLLRAIGTKETGAKDALSESKKVFSDFEALMEKRDGLATETKLTPLEELVGKLVPIGKLTEIEEYDDEYNVTLINTYFEKIRVSLHQDSNTKKSLVIRLDTLKERVQHYISNEELLSNQEKVISKHSKTIAELKPIVEQTKKDTQEEKDSLSIIKGEINELNSVKSMFEMVEDKKERIKVKKVELEQNESDLGELKKSQIGTVEYLKKYERLRDQHKLANNNIENKKQLLIQTEQKRNFQKQWQGLVKINQEIIETILPEIEKRKSEYLESKSRCDNEVSEADEAYSTKKKALESLNIASSAIQEAVSNISKHLVEDQRDCPVCQANYEPSDLIKRIEGSLNKLNPSIPLAIEEERNASEALGIAKKNQKNENKKLLDIQTELNAEHVKLEANKMKISERLLPQFPGCNTPEEANNDIEKQITQITSEISELETNRSQLEPEEVIEELDNANLKKREDERAIDELIPKNERLQSEIATETADISSTNESLSGKDKEMIIADITSKLIKEKGQIDLIQKLEANLSKTEVELKECQDSFSSESEAASKIKGSQEGICTEWSLAGLEGQPNEEELKVKHEVSLKAINELEKANTSLKTIEQDLASWRTAEKIPRL